MQVAKSPPRSQKNALKSAHFVLSALPSTVLVSKIKLNSPKSTVMKSETLFMAIPKRLLKRAVDRNAVKRICREAWRLKSIKSSSHSENSEDVQTALLVTEAEAEAKAKLKPKLLKLISLPSFESTKQLKYLMRADVDVLFAKLK